MLSSVCLLFLIVEKLSFPFQRCDVTIDGVCFMVSPETETYYGAKSQCLVRHTHTHTYTHTHAHRHTPRWANKDIDTVLLQVVSALVLPLFP